MRGIDIARAYYNEYGREMLERELGDMAGRAAVGLAGEGSECMGYDDRLSRDHDFEPGFCIWLTEEDERAFGFRLQRAYSRLPGEFMGLKRQPLAPVGGSRRGVSSIGNFYRRFLGAAAPPDTPARWLYTPSQTLRAACSGEVFRDDTGEFSRVRTELLKGYPEDIRRKKLAAHGVMMAQAGQYNFRRCVSREDAGGAQLCAFEFVNNAISAVYLLNNSYRPFYKWAYRGMRELPLLGDLEKDLISLTAAGVMEEWSKKEEIIMKTAERLARAFRAQDLTGTAGSDLERLAYSIMDGIKDGEIRNMNILDGV